MQKIAFVLLLFASCGVFAQVSCGLATKPSYIDVTLDPANKEVSAFVYDLSGNYVKTPLAGALVFRTDKSDPASLSLCYEAAGADGRAQFAYEPNKPGRQDYWFVFCPQAAAAVNDFNARNECLGSVLSDSFIEKNPPHCDTTNTASPTNHPTYLLSHNELYIFNQVPKDFGPLCWPLMLIFGFLVGASFLLGRNPFQAFDFASPRMGRGKQYTMRAQAKSFDLMSYAMASESISKNAGKAVGKITGNTKKEVYSKDGAHIGTVDKDGKTVKNADGAVVGTLGKDGKTFTAAGGDNKTKKVNTKTEVTRAFQWVGPLGLLQKGLGLGANKTGKLLGKLLPGGGKKKNADEKPAGGFVGFVNKATGAVARTLFFGIDTGLPNVGKKKEGEQDARGQTARDTSQKQNQSMAVSMGGSGLAGIGDAIRGIKDLAKSLGQLSTKEGRQALSEDGKAQFKADINRALSSMLSALGVRTDKVSLWDLFKLFVNASVFLNGLGGTFKVMGMGKNNFLSKNFSFAQNNALFLKAGMFDTSLSGYGGVMPYSASIFLSPLIEETKGAIAKSHDAVVMRQLEAEGVPGGSFKVKGTDGTITVVLIGGKIEAKDASGAVLATGRKDVAALLEQEKKAQMTQKADTEDERKKQASTLNALDDVLSSVKKYNTKEYNTKEYNAKLAEYHEAEAGVLGWSIAHSEQREQSDQQKEQLKYVNGDYKRRLEEAKTKLEGYEECKDDKEREVLLAEIGDALRFVGLLEPDVKLTGSNLANVKESFEKRIKSYDQNSALLSSPILMGNLAGKLEKLLETKEMLANYNRLSGAQKRKLKTALAGIGVTVSISNSSNRKAAAGEIDQKLGAFAPQLGALQEYGVIKDAKDLKEAAEDLRSCEKAHENDAHNQMLSALYVQHENAVRASKSARRMQKEKDPQKLAEEQVKYQKYVEAGKAAAWAIMNSDDINFASAKALSLLALKKEVMESGAQGTVVSAMKDVWDAQKKIAEIWSMDEKDIETEAKGLDIPISKEGKEPEKVSAERKGLVLKEYYSQLEDAYSNLDASLKNENKLATALENKKFAAIVENAKGDATNEELMEACATLGIEPTDAVRGAASAQAYQLAVEISGLRALASADVDLNKTDALAKIRASKTTVIMNILDNIGTGGIRPENLNSMENDVRAISTNVYTVMNTTNLQAKLYYAHTAANESEAGVDFDNIKSIVDGVGTNIERIDMSKDSASTVLKTSTNWLTNSLDTLNGLGRVAAEQQAQPGSYEHKEDLIKLKKMTNDAVGAAANAIGAENSDGAAVAERNAQTIRADCLKLLINMGDYNGTVAENSKQARIEQLQKDADKLRTESDEEKLNLVEAEIKKVSKMDGDEFIKHMLTTKIDEGIANISANDPAAWTMRYHVSSGAEDYNGSGVEYQSDDRSWNRETVGQNFDRWLDSLVMTEQKAYYTSENYLVRQVQANLGAVRAPSYFSDPEQQFLDNLEAKIQNEQGMMSKIGRAYGRVPGFESYSHYMFGELELGAQGWNVKVEKAPEQPPETKKPDAAPQQQVGYFEKFPKATGPLGTYVYAIDVDVSKVSKDFLEKTGFSGKKKLTEELQKTLVGCSNDFLASNGMATKEQLDIFVSKQLVLNKDGMYQITRGVEGGLSDEQIGAWMHHNVVLTSKDSPESVMKNNKGAFADAAVKTAVLNLKGETPQEKAAAFMEFAKNNVNTIVEDQNLKYTYTHKNDDGTTVKRTTSMTEKNKKVAADRHNWVNNLYSSWKKPAAEQKE